MYEHVKTGCKHIPPGEQPLQFQSGYFMNKPRMLFICIKTVTSSECSSIWQANIFNSTCCGSGCSHLLGRNLHCCTIFPEKLFKY